MGIVIIVSWEVNFTSAAFPTADSRALDGCIYDSEIVVAFPLQGPPEKRFSFYLAPDSAVTQITGTDFGAMARTLWKYATISMRIV